MMSPCDIIDSEQRLSSKSSTTVSASAVPPWAMVVFAIFSVQLGAAIAKSLFDAAGPGGVVFLRTLLGAAAFVILFRSQIRTLNRQVVRYGVLYGALTAANMLVFYAAIERIPLGITVAIAFMGPLMVSVLGSRRLIDFVWIFVAAVGILLISPITDVTLDPVGIVLAGLTACAWGVYIVLTKRAATKASGNGVLVVGMITASIITAPIGASHVRPILISPALIGLTLVMAFFSLVLPFWLEFIALRSLSSRVFGLLMSVEPAAAALLGWVILGEFLSIEKILGIALVTIAAAATTREQ